MLNPKVHECRGVPIKVGLSFKSKITFPPEFGVTVSLDSGHKYGWFGPIGFPS